MSTPAGAPGTPTGTADGPLTLERVLDTAEEVLRRYGPAKATVVDVARALGVSHGSVYRHVASKAALRDAVVERWLARVAAPLDAYVTADGAALERLHGWLEALVAIKRAKVGDDPELFAAYSALAAEAEGAVAAHVDHLVAQLTAIVADGAAAGELRAEDPARTARALLDATGRFHNPAHAAEWSSPTIDAELDGVWTIIAAGLQKPATQRVP